MHFEQEMEKKVGSHVYRTKSKVGIIIWLFTNADLKSIQTDELCGNLLPKKVDGKPNQ